MTATRKAVREMLNEAGPALIHLCGIGIAGLCAFIIILVLAPASIR